MRELVYPTTPTTGTIKAITLHQPWASLIAIGAKSIETRSWPARYTGPLAIHAGKFSMERQRVVLDMADIFRNFDSGFNGAVPYGAIIAVCDLTGCTRMDGPFIHAVWAESIGTEYDMDCGNYEIGRCAWHLANVRPLPHPIPCRGKQGLWTPDDDVQRQIRTQLAAHAPATGEGE